MTGDPGPGVDVVPPPGPERDPARLSVLVLNWNGEADSAACLDSLIAQRGERFDLLLIDNGSADGSGERLHARYPVAHYLQTGSNLGYAEGNNRGIAWALERGARWIMVLNNDTVADADLVARLLAAAEADPLLGAVAPLITRYDDPSRVWFAGGRFDAWRALGVHEREGEPVQAVLCALDSADSCQPATFLSGCCLVLRADAVRAVGAFRGDFFAYVEDVDLSVRLLRSGWRLGWVPSARLAHRVPAAGAPPSPFQIRLRDRNRRRLARDELPRLRWLAFSLWFWPTRLMHLLRYLGAGDRARAVAILAGMTER